MMEESGDMVSVPTMQSLFPMYWVRSPYLCKLLDMGIEVTLADPPAKLE